MSYQNTGKPTGRPLLERNLKIIEDAKLGMTSTQLAEKYNISKGYAQKISSEYARKEKIKKIKIDKAGFGLYVERDLAMLQHMQFILKSVPKSCIHTIKEIDNIRTNKSYIKQRIVGAD